MDLSFYEQLILSIARNVSPFSISSEQYAKTVDLSARAIIEQMRSGRKCSDCKHHSDLDAGDDGGKPYCSASNIYLAVDTIPSPAIGCPFFTNVFEVE